MTERLAYRVPEVAELLSVSEGTVWNLLRSGQLSRRKVGRATLITLASIESFLNEEPGLSSEIPARQPQ